MSPVRRRSRKWRPRRCRSTYLGRCRCQPCCPGQWRRRPEEKKKRRWSFLCSFTLKNTHTGGAGGGSVEDGGCESGAGDGGDGVAEAAGGAGSPAGAGVG